MQQVSTQRGLTFVLALTAALAASSCGYALAGRGSFLPQDIRVVGIPLLENKTTQQRVEQKITEKIRNEFIDRGAGKYKIVPTTGGADAVLTGTITSITTQAVGLTEQQFASRYLVTVTMRVQFTDARNSQVIWSNEALTFSQEYDLGRRGSGQVEGVVLLEEEAPALERLASDLGRSVVTSILEAF